ncbi:MAG TPA: hypothetical protein VJ011_00505, partial [Steroidobacteraceae bacterium]|nr:hypothetical protein [Steroidobacteraceae bacterium]
MRALPSSAIVAGLIGTFALAQSAHAWECEFRADRSGGIDVAGVKRIVLRTGAGDLKATGRDAAARIEASGVACASTKELLDATTINVRREGDTAFVETAIPVERLKLL